MHHWSIILAGGEGTRMRSMVRNRLGSDRPKQFCTFCGSRSMFEHTLTRCTQLVEPSHIVTVIQKRHRRYLETQNLPGSLIEQPVSRDTAVGVLLPAAYILGRDPEALIYVFPSDHFIYPEPSFIEQMKRVAILAEGQPNKLVLVGAEATHPETDYGWIEPGRPLKGWSWSARQTPYEVRAFQEKPPKTLAEEWFALGHFWNTLIFSGKAECLWNQAARGLPEVLRILEPVRTLAASGDFEPGSRREEELLLKLFTNLPRTNISSALFSQIAEDCLVFPLRDVFWSDWGRPSRIDETLARFGTVTREMQSA